MKRSASTALILALVIASPAGAARPAKITLAAQKLQSGPAGGRPTTSRLLLAVSAALTATAVSALPAVAGQPAAPPLADPELSLLAVSGIAAIDSFRRWRPWPSGPKDGLAPTVELKDQRVVKELFRGLFGREPSPEDLTELVKQIESIYLQPAKRKGSLSDARVKAITLSQELAGSSGLPLDELTDPDQVLASADRILRSGALSAPQRAALEKIVAIQQRVKLLADLPSLMAEGTVRSEVSALTPGQLDRTAAARWGAVEAKPVADVAVVGLGPFGLATALHAQEQGLKVVGFDAGYLAQSFSDAAMKPVYRMRTSAAASSLAREPFSPGSLARKVSLLNRLKAGRRQARAADDRFFKLSQEPVSAADRAIKDPADAQAPAFRSELFRHFIRAARAAALSLVLVEGAPVVSIVKKANGLWRLTTSKGHVQLARKVVLGQGQVGAKAEWSEFPEDWARLGASFPRRFLVLRDRAALTRSAFDINAVLARLRRREPAPSLVFHDSLLGAPEMRESIRLLPPGSALAIIGSGESAAKAVIDALRINPRVRVHLFSKGEFSSAQLQIPAAHARPEAIASALSDSAAGRRTLKEWKEFGTPITPSTFEQLDALMTAQFVHHRLGARAVLKRGSGPLEAGQLRAHVSGGLIGRAHFVYKAEDRPVSVPIDGPIIIATGYDRELMRRSALTRQLRDDGRVDLDNGRTLSRGEIRLDDDNHLTSAADPDLYVGGAQNFAMSADSAIPGMVARAAAVAEHIARSLRPAATAGGSIDFWK